MKQKLAYGYIRVSRKRQGVKGLSIEAQAADIDRYCIANHLKLLEKFIEIESGKKNHRPKIEEAIRRCREKGAKLVIATLDRLSRKVIFIAMLIESKIDFVAVDRPYADKYSIYIEAARAEDESDRISTRTKAALQVAKRRGKKLGKFGKILAQRNICRSKAFVKRLAPILVRLKKSGFKTAHDIAAELNRMRIKTYRKDGVWSIGSVYHLLCQIKLSGLTV